MYPHCTGRLLRFAVTALSLLLAAHSGVASAAPDTVTGNAIEEILVTARRREELSIAVPMSLTRLDGAMLDSLQYRNIDEILGLSPGVLVYTGGDGVSSQITIRGVVTPGQLVEPGNAVYVDDIYVSGMLTLLPGFYDIQSVQVLKGPQAGLYGRNTTGGAVVITTGQPTEELFARLNASYAQYDTRQMDGTINVPLGDALRMRATLWYDDTGGGYYQSDFVNQNLDAANERGGRLTLALLPNERTALTLTGEYDRIRETGFSGLLQGAQLGPPPLPPESRHNVLRDDLGGLEQDIAGINSKLAIDATAGSLTAVAGWREVKAREPGSDFDGTAFTASYADFLANPSTPLATPSPEVLTRDDRDRSLNGELRFLTPDRGGPLSTQIGLSYFEETTRLAAQVAPVDDFALILATIGQDTNFSRGVDQNTRSWAGFTEVIWTPVPTVEITTDLRYTRDQKQFELEQLATGIYSRPSQPNITLDTTDTFKNWSPGITLAYKPDATLTVFGKYVRGFRAGGFNTLVNDPALLTYDSEEADNYELGFRTLQLGGRLELGASVFYLRIDNALVPQADIGELVTFYPLQNPGTAETTGLEVDLTAQLADGLALTTSGGAYHYSLSNGGLVGGDQRPFAPDYTASLVADYERPLTAAITGIATLGYRHRSGGRVPGSTWIDMDSYNLVDAQIGIRVGNMQLAGFVRNALDDDYVVGNSGPAIGQVRYIGLAESLSARALIRDPGTIFGARMTLIF